jgi:hypothetical protein
VGLSGEAEMANMKVTFFIPDELLMSRTLEFNSLEKAREALKSHQVIKINVEGNGTFTPSEFELFADDIAQVRIDPNATSRG